MKALQVKQGKCIGELKQRVHFTLFIGGRKSFYLHAKYQRSARSASLQGLQTVLTTSEARSERNEGSFCDCGVIVEGHSDRIAVQAAVQSKVLVLGSSTSVSGLNSEKILAACKSGLSRFNKLMVLMDPDVAGRQARSQLEAVFPGQLWHAFLPSKQATAAESTRWHAAGNIGVEHASPAQIRLALQQARKADLQRKVFTRDKLKSFGLSAEFNSDSQADTNIAARRRQVCDLLGIGNCDAKQLMKQLNTYNFTEEDVMHALEAIKI